VRSVRPQNPYTGLPIFFLVVDFFRPSPLYRTSLTPFFLDSRSAVVAPYAPPLPPKDQRTASRTKRPTPAPSPSTPLQLFDRHARTTLTPCTYSCHLSHPTVPTPLTTPQGPGLTLRYSSPSLLPFIARHAARTRRAFLAVRHPLARLPFLRGNHTTTAVRSSCALFVCARPARVVPSVAKSSFLQGSASCDPHIRAWRTAGHPSLRAQCRLDGTNLHLQGALVGKVQQRVRGTQRSVQCELRL
jgi:hypothetical protein